MRIPGVGDRETAVALVARGFRAALVGLLAYGAAVGNAALVVNGLLALAVTLVPAFVGRRYDHRVDPRIATWIALAAVLHVAGFLGPYQAQTGFWSWYDQAAHAVTASFIAGVGYAVIVALDRRSSRIRFPDGFRYVFTLCLILAFGVAWEIAEFAAGGLVTTLGGEAPLVQYGTDDIVLDLLFNTLAAALVALRGIGYFGGLAALLSRSRLRPGER